MAVYVCQASKWLSNRIKGSRNVNSSLSSLRMTDVIASRQEGRVTIKRRCRQWVESGRQSIAAVRRWIQQQINACALPCVCMYVCVYVCPVLTAHRVHHHRHHHHYPYKTPLPKELRRVYAHTIYTLLDTDVNTWWWSRVNCCLSHSRLPNPLMTKMSTRWPAASRQIIMPAPLHPCSYRNH